MWEKVGNRGNCGKKKGGTKGKNGHDGKIYDKQDKTKWERETTRGRQAEEEGCREVGHEWLGGKGEGRRRSRRRRASRRRRRRRGEKQENKNGVCEKKRRRERQTGSKGEGGKGGGQTEKR